MKVLEEEPQPFNNIMHMNSFVSYLMRTDANQKWTTSTTKYNTVSLKTTNEKFETKLIGEDLKAKKKIETYIRKQVTTRNITQRFSKKFKMGLYYFEFEGEKISKDNLINFVNNLITNLEKDAVKEESICYVCHVDQEELHVHRIFLKK